MEKTDAQQRNEDEVRRIMRERGFETASESKSKKKRRDFDFSIIGKVLAAIVVIGGLFGVFALINAPKNNEMIKIRLITKTRLRTPIMRVWQRVWTRHIQT